MIFYGSWMSVGVTQPGSVSCDRWRARSGLRGSGHRKRGCLWSGRGSLRMAPAIATPTSTTCPKGHARGCGPVGTVGLL